MYAGFGVWIIFRTANCDLEASLTQKGKSKLVKPPKKRIVPEKIFPVPTS